MDRSHSRTVVLEALAAHLLARWREQGFDVLNKFRSGFCSPASRGQQVRDGESLPIDSDDAVRALAVSMFRGASYSFKEFGGADIADESDLVAIEGKRILVVEDREDTRDLVKVILTTSGATVEAVDSADAALQLLDSQPFDALVVDIMMPVTDGYRMLQILRRREVERGGQTPAVALTALDSGQYRELAIDAGFQIHLGKPVEVNRLTSAVAALVR